MCGCVDGGSCCARKSLSMSLLTECTQDSGRARLSSEVITIDRATKTNNTPQLGAVDDVDDVCLSVRN